MMNSKDQILTCKKWKERDWGWAFFCWEGRGRAQVSDFEQGWGRRCLHGKQVRSKIKRWRRQDAIELQSYSTFGDLQSYTRNLHAKIRSSMVSHIKPKAYKYYRLQRITFESYMITHK